MESNQKSAPPVPSTGTELGNYVIESRLGSGGFGIVFRARHLVTRRQVALKLLTAKDNPEIGVRFRREAAVGNQIGSDHIVQAYDFGEYNGQPFIVMELLEGRSLSAEVRKIGPLPIERTFPILEQTAEALSKAHAHGVVHRDLKPGNIFLVPHGNNADFVKILDFGVAKFLEPSDSVKTSTLALIGSPQTMSPEQCRGSAIDHRSDVYAIGVVMFYMIGGRYPFTGNQAEIISGHLRDTPPILRVAGAEIDPKIQAILQKALAKDPADRYQTMLEFRAALIQYRTGSVATFVHTPKPVPVASVATLVGAKTVDVSPKSKRRVRKMRHRLIMALGVVVFVGTSALCWQLLHRRPQAKPVSVPPPVPVYHLAITTEPAEAQVVIDDVVQAESRPLQVSGPAGKVFHVVATMPGFEKTDVPLTISAQRTSEVIRLTPIVPPAPAIPTGTIIVRAKPVCDVLLDGKPVGKTPLDLPASAGKHKITLSNAAQHRKQDFRFRLSADGHKRISAHWDAK